MQPYYTRANEKNSINQDMNPTKEKHFLQEEIKKRREESQYLAEKIQKKKIRAQKDHINTQKKDGEAHKISSKTRRVMEAKKFSRIFFACNWPHELIHEREQGMHMEHNQINPDLMTYQQLLQLGDSIGKVSRGISEQDFLKLKRAINIKKNQNCSICITNFEVEQKIVELPCRHQYHEECIGQWLKEFNSCPMCKKCVLGE